MTDPHHDFIPAGQQLVKSDTGELTRNWQYGIQTIDTPKTQAVLGWIGEKVLKLSTATFRFGTPKAVIVLTSLDDEPLSTSGLILVTAMARVVPGTPPSRLPFLSEPVVGEITLRTQVRGLQLLPLSANGRIQERLALKSDADGVTLRLPNGRGTHWYLLTPAEPAQDIGSPASSPTQSP